MPGRWTVTSLPRESYNKLETYRSAAKENCKESEDEPGPAGPYSCKRNSVCVCVCRLMRTHLFPPVQLTGALQLLGCLLSKMRKQRAMENHQFSVSLTPFSHSVLCFSSFNITAMEERNPLGNKMRTNDCKVWVYMSFFFFFLFLS